MKGLSKCRTHTFVSSLLQAGAMIYLIGGHGIPITSANGAGDVKVTLPSRNEATNPLKEPTPSTLQGAFMVQNLTDAGNGSPTPSTVTEANPQKPSTTTADHSTVGHTASEIDKNATKATTVSVDHRDEVYTAAIDITNTPKLVTTASATVDTVELDASTATTDTVDTTTVEPTTVESRRVDDGTTVETPQSVGATKSNPNFDLNNKNLAKMLKSWFDIEDDGDVHGGYYKLTKYLKDATAAKSPGKNLFDRWDEASDEQERLLEEAMRTADPESSVLAADQNNPSRWFVLLLTGNSTVAQMRRSDFAKYLKLNLAARLSLQYDEIKINRVLVVPPRLMVNVSVVPAEQAEDSVEDDPLHNLVETNATLMELSGEEYRVERFMSLKSHKPQSLEESNAVVSTRHSDIDFFIYSTVGPLCFLVILGFLLLSLYKYVRKHPVQWPWKRKIAKPSFMSPWSGQRHRRMDECAADEGSSVNVIYSGEFEQSQQQQLSGSWLDDANFAPDDSLDRIRTPALQQRPGPKNKAVTELLCETTAAAPVHQSPRLSRENKLRILGCKHSCLLLPPQPVQQQHQITDTPSPQSQNDAEP
ncbi:uncharacterized protein LOC126834484 [Adelges cooleyi]|uniref:uncharacterized protein LOC126834484 n=1 Tax=Adelges cooleyi TaxID=133065 RepID=UPI00217FFC75|nr:uncharacterized protein LOC126834484 [Adelges cooleyi]